jgi:hypothetical protein
VQFLVGSLFSLGGQRIIIIYSPFQIFPSTEETFKIPTLKAINKCNLFQNNPTPFVSPRHVRSPISLSLSVFRQFIALLERNVIDLTDTNLTEFEPLSEEFVVSELASKLSEFHSSMSFKAEA